MKSRNIDDISADEILTSLEWGGIVDFELIMTTLAALVEEVQCLKREVKYLTDSDIDET